MANSTIQSFNDILADLKNGDIRCLYVLFGQEDFLKRKLLTAIEQLVVNPQSKEADRVIFDFENTPKIDDWDKVITELKTPPFFSKRKLIVIKNANLFKSAKTNKISSDLPDSDQHIPHIKWLDYCSESSCLIVIEDQIDKRQKQLIAQIQSVGVLGEIQKPDIRIIRTWIVSEFKKERIQILSESCDHLIERNDSDLQSIQNEIQKLVLYAQYYSKEKIEIEDIENICLTDLKGNVFRMIDALSAKKSDEAFSMLNGLILQKQPVPLIYHMVIRHIRQLILAKDLGNAKEIMSVAKVIPFVANKLNSQSKSFTEKSLEAIYSKGIEWDLAVKSSQISDRIALEMLCASVLSGTSTY